MIQKPNQPRKATTIMRYTVTVPPTAEVGSYKTTVTSSGKWGNQTYRQAALQDYNSCRAHDGLPPVRRMPAGTCYTPQYEYALQGNYGSHCQKTRQTSPPTGIALRWSIQTNRTTVAASSSTVSASLVTLAR